MGDFNKITIIGVGLIGGSLGLAIKALQSPPKVVGVSRSEQTIEKAIKVEAIDEGTTSKIDAVKDADLVFIATPISSIVGTIKEITPHLKPGAIVTDVGSTKSTIVKTVEEFLPPEIFFIGGHPMAGSEQQGVLFANATLFRNSYYLLTPTQRTNTMAFKKLHSLLTGIGAQVLAVDPDKHDKIVSTISHLPHILSAALVNLASKQTKESKNLLLVAAGGFRDMTRIAASDPDMWRDICIENSAAILEALDEFRKELMSFQSTIEDRKESQLKDKFKEAQSVRLNLPEILHKDVSQLRELSIPVSDRPGVISDISVMIGRLGINIEDIEIVHTTELTGILRLVISGEENAKAAAKELLKHKYEVEIGKIYNHEVP